MVSGARWSSGHPVLATLVALALTGCGDSPAPGDAAADQSCPASRPAQNDSCPAPSLACSYDHDNPYSGTCLCLDSWHCSSCPADFPSETSCPPGATCTVVYSEDDCSCGCDASGHWHCSSTEGIIHCPFPA